MEAKVIYERLYYIIKILLCLYSPCFSLLPVWTKGWGLNFTSSTNEDFWSKHIQKSLGYQYEVIHKTPVTLWLWSHSYPMASKKNAECRGVYNAIASSAAVPQWHHQ